MERNTHFISTRLEQRKQENSLRSLSTAGDLIDFCSNDYLGFASSSELRSIVNKELESFPDYLLGSTGSRLISGNDIFTEQLENEIAIFHDAEAGLIFNSGYDANLGLFSSLGQRGDTIITDEFIHASIIDGARLSHANRFIFKHNDLDSLEEKLKAAKGAIYIAVESIYSMDGDEAPLENMINLAEKYNAVVIVDEAHATGVFGSEGRGLVHKYGLQNRVFARTVTFGKAIGVHGAIILGSKPLRDYLINFARSFIYSTAGSFYTHLSVKMAYQFLRSKNYPELIADKINIFKEYTDDISNQFIKSHSTIQSMIISGNEQTRMAARSLQNQGFDVRPILSPTVQPGKERLRICLHTFNTDEDIMKLAASLKKLI
ncbi:MAG TPA: 8-amino-7-oxononanoate synthase [Sphingobacteriaceae bacterium]|nr:8-amino-7-oxononanoate synthase [Sphingobacteriaceae bacterium]